ncbi:MAG TPA: GAP family protein [Lapillicoccus sp.]|nr:GAP family protein [Lapillicoccus sp.]
MGPAIGQSLPIAVGVMVSPLPIVAVVLMLLSQNARANAFAFVLTWLVAIALLTGVVAFLAGAATGTDEAPPVWVSVVKILLGAGLLLLSVRSWRSRPGEGEEPPPPSWMAALDGFTPVKSAGLSAVLADVNPKNLLLVVSGGAAIASAAAGSTSAKVAATIVFAVVASLGVATPLVIYLALGDRAGAVLENLRSWLVHNNAGIMAVLLLVLGAKIVGDGISGF